jgi:hypothetical protein
MLAAERQPPSYRAPDIAAAPLQSLTRRKPNKTHRRRFLRDTHATSNDA